jgi:RNA polymerase sigma-70 factor (ECF subfamily)
MKAPDPRLVLLAQQGDRPALDALLGQCQASLGRYVASLVGGDPALSDDVLQETLLRIVTKLRWLDEPKVFRAWAFRIASREAFRALEARGRRHAEPIDDERFDIDSLGVTVDPPELDRQLDLQERKRLHGAVASLSPASRAVVSLHYFAELPLDEVADTLGVPLGTVKSRLAYGLAALRRSEEISP